MEYAGFQGNFIKGEAHQIDLPDESFDLIVSRNLVWTLTKPVETYKEWYRLLKLKGKILVFDANWYLRLADNELQQQYDYYRKLALEQGLIDDIPEEKHREGEEIAWNLPLTYEKRPEWDMDILSRLGYKEVIVEKNLNELVYDDVNKLLYKPIPLFGLCASK